MNTAPLRVAVIGAGPAGIFAADALVQQDDVPVEVWILDRLPTPFGLVRYGVAPDHTPIRDVRLTLESVLKHDRVHFVGNVEVGRDFSLQELRRHLDAVVHAWGAAADRRLDLRGEDLPGSLAALDLVRWYCGYPDVDREAVEAVLATARTAAVVGAGNVALDVARILVKDRSALSATDMPQHVLDALAASPVRHVHLVARRGPASAAFTTKELRELGQLPGVDVLVDRKDLEVDPGEAAAASKVTARNLAVLSGWADKEPVGHERSLHLHFWARPQAVTGQGSVDGLVVERTRPDGVGGVLGTGDFNSIPAQMVVRAVGYRSVPLDGLPFDHDRHVVPNERGRVVVEGGTPVRGQYVAGWAKRGPSGVVGTNKTDAQETIVSLIEDAPILRDLSSTECPDLEQLLVARGRTPVTLAGWRRIDSAEVELGRSYGRSRTTLHDREQLVLIGTGLWTVEIVGEQIGSSGSR